MRKSLFSIILKTLTLLIVGGSVGLFTGVAISPDIFPEIINKIFPLIKNDKESKHTEDTITVKRIEQVAKIVSIEYHMSDIIEYRNDNRWPFKDEKVLIIAKAKVLAGFDLLKGSVSIKIDETIQENQAGKKQILIVLPQPQIISIEPSYKYYDISGSVPVDTHNWILARAKVNLRNAAIQAGILENAKKTVQMQLQQMFIDSEVYVDFSTEESYS
jgi:hypothetical protein